MRALGRALGYPPYCIEAFTPSRDRSNAENWFAALHRTSGHASAFLNDAVGGRALLSHVPCRYDCPAALRYARALWGELSSVSPVAAAELRHSLEGLMVLFRDAGALRLTVTAQRAPGAYRVRAVERLGVGDAVEAWCAVLDGADGIQVLADTVRVFREGDEFPRIAAPRDRVLVRLFA